MARPLRVEFAGAVYHVTARGNAGQEIFLDPTDRAAFLDTLAEVVARFGWLCHAYCLMGNHYHFLIETPKPSLSQGMRQLNGIYTQAFNRRHGRNGHVLQGRFKAILVEKEPYLLELARYVVLNPVRVGLARAAKDWPWSSYRATAGLGDSSPFLAVDWLLAQFSSRRGKAQEIYRRFVSAGRGVEMWNELKGGVVLGGDKFAKKVARHLKGQVGEVSRAQRLIARPALSDLFAGIGGSTRKRNARIHTAYMKHGYRLSEIGEAVGLHYSTVSRIVRRQQDSRQDKN